MKNFLKNTSCKCPLCFQEGSKELSNKKYWFNCPWCGLRCPLKSLIIYKKS